MGRRGRAAQRARSKPRPRRAGTSRISARSRVSALRAATAHASGDGCTQQPRAGGQGLGADAAGPAGRPCADLSRRPEDAQRNNVLKSASLTLPSPAGSVSGDWARPWPCPRTRASSACLLAGLQALRLLARGLLVRGQRCRGIGRCLILASAGQPSSLSAQRTRRWRFEHAESRRNDGVRCEEGLDHQAPHRCATTWARGRGRAWPTSAASSGMGDPTTRRGVRYL